jgi:hypothetical protein
VDVRFPKWLLDSKLEFYNAIRMPEFAAQIKDYLSTIGPNYPKTIEDLIDRSNRFTAPRADGARPNPGRWALFKREASRRVSERMCKQVSVSLPYRGDSHDDQYDDYTGVAGSTSC